MLIPRSLFWLLLALLGTSCERRMLPHVVLVTLDTTRADRIGAMGYQDARTPALDAFAARGVVFERAFASAPITLPSHTTMLTGLDPNRHGVHDNGLFVAPPSLETVTERLEALGYDTAAFVSAFVLDSSFGLDQGFDLYDDFTPQQSIRSTVPSRDGRDTTDAALAWLRQRRSAPLFLWVHYFDVHKPRVPPSPYDGHADSYDGAVAYVDSLFGRLLAGVEQAAGGRDTLVIVVGDHGESLGEHDEATHGIVAYDSTLHVPLIVSGPGFGGERRSRVFARTADIAPTILSAVDDPPLAAADGRPLQAALADWRSSEVVGYFETFLPAFTMGWARIGGVRTERWKYTAEPRPVELYDTLADPGETVNLADHEPEVIARLAPVYASIQRGSEPEARAAQPPLEVAERLRALGYVSAPIDFPPDRTPDPRRVVGLTGRIHDMEAIAAEGRVADAIRSLERVIDEEPIGRPLALLVLARLYLLADRRDDCIRTARELAALTGTAESRLELASTLVEVGRPNEALAEITSLEASGVVNSSTLSLLLERARAYLAAGRLDEAEHEAGKLLTSDPTSDIALALVTLARAASGDPAIEISRLEAELERREDSARLIETRQVLAALLHAQRRDEEAVRVIEVAAYKSPDLRVLLAEIAESRGNLAEAAGHYARALSELTIDLTVGAKLADVYKRLGRYAESLELYDRVIAIKPEEAFFYVDRGAVRFLIGKRVEAAADYRKAISLDPGLPEPHRNLALVFLKEGNEAAAEKSLLRAVELREDYAKAHLNLARLYRARNDPRADLHAERARRSPASSHAPPIGRTP